MPSLDDLDAIAAFVERMRNGGAIAVRVGPVAVSFYAMPPVPGTKTDKRKKKPTEEQLLFHSS